MTRPDRPAVAINPSSSKRPTITDIARRAGVSKGTVSFALNGRPGVAPSTRERILAAAAELGWQPSILAQALSRSRAHAVGMVIARPARTLGYEPFFMELISGIEDVLAGRRVALVLQVAPDLVGEQETLRRWWGERRVDGVFVVDLRLDDPRIGLIEEIGLPAVVVGGPGRHGSLPSVWTDNSDSVARAIRYLSSIGHDWVAYVCGRQDLVHTKDRMRAFEELAAEIPLGTTLIVPTDYSGEQGARATRDLLSRRDKPTAILYDNDVMAVAGAAVAHEMGLVVPRDLSVVALEDSALCQLVHPPLTALARDVPGYGRMSAQALLDVLDGTPTQDALHAGETLVVRGTTAAPARHRVPTVAD